MCHAHGVLYNAWYKRHYIQYIASADVAAAAADVVADTAAFVVAHSQKRSLVIYDVGDETMSDASTRSRIL